MICLKISIFALALTTQERQIPEVKKALKSEFREMKKIDKTKK